MEVSIAAAGKINLGLEIGALQADGYHYIQTVMQTVGLYDYLRLQPGERSVFLCSNFNFPPGEKNICLRACEVFSQAAGINQPVKISLEKYIPVASGLGGGSSDAAAVIIGLNRLWNCRMSNQELSDIAAKIGSDVPFFTAEHQGAALCCGRGELVQPIDPLCRGWALIVYTGIEVSTAWAYKSYDDNLTKCEKNVNLKEYVLSCFPALKGLNDVKNDFQEIVFSTHPVLKKIALTLKKQGALFSSLSGSGSAVFGLYRTKADAEQAAKHLPPYPVIAVVPTPAPNSYDLLQIN